MRVIDLEHNKRMEIQAFMDKAQAIAEASANEKEYNGDFTRAYEYGYTLSYMAGVLKKLNLTKKQMAILKAYR
jgi:hypothetical protein